MFHYFKLFCKVCLDVSGKVCMNIKTQVLNFIVENMTVILHFVEEFKTSIGKKRGYDATTFCYLKIKVTFEEVG